MSGTTAPMIGAEISHLMSEFLGRSDSDESDPSFNNTLAI